MSVVICLKIRTFVVSTTTRGIYFIDDTWLWFAWKFVPLWYQQQQRCLEAVLTSSCDLLENSYLCGINNNGSVGRNRWRCVVICLKIRTFVVSTTTSETAKKIAECCDLLENSYLCGINNNRPSLTLSVISVVICLKIRTFVVSTTTLINTLTDTQGLWFAWKFVPLWYQQQPPVWIRLLAVCCDLLENSYLCGINNNGMLEGIYLRTVVICLKIRTFVVSTTTNHEDED